MPTYRLYFLDGASRVSSAEWIEATDEAAAVGTAADRCASRRGELWQGNRRIATLPLAR